MKVFSVIGYTKSGKTTTIENIVKELKRRNYSVGTVKDIHFDKFTMETEGKNTFRHKQAGAELVTARGLYETDVLYQKKLDIHEILKHYSNDYVILEGVRDINAPKIITAETSKDIDERLDYSTFLISGRIADKISDYKGIKALSALDDIETLVDYIEQNIFERLPDFKEECCDACGYSCKKMCELILKGEKSRNDCIISKENISLNIDGNNITMVPFVQKILKNAVLSVVSELEGYTDGANIQIELGCDFTKLSK